MGSMAISADAGSMGGATTQSPVLRVIVENLFYPVTLDVLHQVQGAFLVFLSKATYLFHRLQFQLCMLCLPAPFKSLNRPPLDFFLP